MKKIFKNGMGWGSNDEIPKHGKKLTSPDQLEMDKVYLFANPKGWWIGKCRYEENAVEMVGLGTKVYPHQYEVYLPSEDIETGFQEIFTYDSKKELFDALGSIYEVNSND